MLLSPHIAAHLGMPGSIPQRKRSTQKPHQCRRARTAGSGCPQPAEHSSSAAYRTATRACERSPQDSGERDTARQRDLGERRQYTGEAPVASATTAGGVKITRELPDPQAGYPGTLASVSSPWFSVRDTVRHAIRLGFTPWGEYRAGLVERVRGFAVVVRRRGCALPRAAVL